MLAGHAGEQQGCDFSRSCSKAGELDSKSGCVGFNSLSGCQFQTTKKPDSWSGFSEQHYIEVEVIINALRRKATIKKVGRKKGY